MRFQISVAPAVRPIFAIFGMSPTQTFAEIDESAGTLRVKGGIWFDETFSLRDIVNVAPSSWPWWGGLGVKLGPNNSVGVVGSKEGVLAIRFREKQHMTVLFVTDRDELRISLEDPHGFTQALERALNRGRPVVATA